MIASALFFIALARAAEPGPLGAGLVLGPTTGVTVGYRPTEQNGVQAAVGWDLSAGRLAANADYLQTLRMVRPAQRVHMPVYAGLGAEIAMEGRGTFGEAAGVWARVPVGTSLFFEDVPVEVFVQVIPRVRILPATTFGAEAAVGARYYF